MTSYQVFSNKEKKLLHRKKGEFLGYPLCCSDSLG